MKPRVRLQEYREGNVAVFRVLRMPDKQRYLDRRLTIPSWRPIAWTTWCGTARSAWREAARDWASKPWLR